MFLRIFRWTLSNPKSVRSISKFLNCKNGMKYIFIFLSLLLLTFGCGTQKKLVFMPSTEQAMAVRVGMNKLEVIEIMGSPSSQFIANDELVFAYSSLSNRGILGASYKSYKIIFDDSGKVKKVLDQKGNSIFLIPSMNVKEKTLSE